MAKDDFSKTASDIAKAINLGTKRALNRAAAKANTQMSQKIRDDSGLASAFIKKRLRVYKATNAKMMSSVNVATKQGVHLSEFKPKVVAVRVVPKNATISKRGRAKPKTYYGVTVKIGTQPRGLVPGGFLRTVASGKTLVLARKGDKPYPTVALKTDVIERSALANSDAVAKAMSDSFNDQLQSQIDYALATKFAADSDD